MTDIPADIAVSVRPSPRLRRRGIARLFGFISLRDGGMRGGYPDDVATDSAAAL